MLRRSKLIFLLLLVGIWAGPAAAERPQRPVTVIVPFTHGGPTDMVARPLVKAMAKALGQKVVEKNVPGAGGTLGSEQVARAKPDGYTLLLANIGHAASTALYRELRYDPLADFEPIGLVAEVPMTLVARPRFPAADIKELRSYIASNPDRVTYGHAGIGSASHLCGLLFMKAIKADLATVPYQGTYEALADLLGGRVDLTCDQTTNTRAAIREDKVKVYGVTTKSRLPSLPAVPTLAESGLRGFELSVWHGLYAPKGTPDAVVEKLAAALRDALQDPALLHRFAQVGAQAVPLSKARPEALRARLAIDREKWAAVIKDAGVYAD